MLNNEVFGNYVSLLGSSYIIKFTGNSCEDCLVFTVTLLSVFGDEKPHLRCHQD